MALTQVPNAMLGSDAQFMGFKNRIINGAMAVAQRGTSFSSLANGSLSTSNAYCLDRWFGFRGAYASGLDVSQQAGWGAYQYALRMQRTNGNANATNGLAITQIIETNNCYDLAGQTVAVTVNLRAGANYSGGQVNVNVQSSSTANDTSANLASGTFSLGGFNSNFTITTTGTAYTLVGSIPAGAKTIALQIFWTPTGTAGANDYIEITGVQLEKATAGTTFDWRDYSNELQMCQRYYYQLTGNNLAIASGYNRTTSIFYGIGYLPVAMRIGPSVICPNSAGYFAIDYGTAGTATIPTLAIQLCSTTSYMIVGTPATSVTANSGAVLYTNNASAYLGFTSEL